MGRRERSGEERKTCQVTRAQEQRRARGWEEAARWAWEWESERKAIRSGARLTAGRRGRELVWGSNWSPRSFDRRWKKEVMRSETVQMSRQRRWMQTRTRGDEIKERQEEGGREAGREKKEAGENSEGWLKYLWCHLCWHMTPPPCNNRNGDSVGCLASQNIVCTIYSQMWLFPRRFHFIWGWLSAWRGGRRGAMYRRRGQLTLQRKEANSVKLKLGNLKRYRDCFQNPLDSCHKSSK